MEKSRFALLALLSLLLLPSAYADTVPGTCSGTPSGSCSAVPISSCDSVSGCSVQDLGGSCSLREGGWDFVTHAPCTPSGGSSSPSCHEYIWYCPGGEGAGDCCPALGEFQCEAPNGIDPAMSPCSWSDNLACGGSFSGECEFYGDDETVCEALGCDWEAACDGNGAACGGTGQSNCCSGLTCQDYPMALSCSSDFVCSEEQPGATCNTQTGQCEFSNTCQSCRASGQSASVAGDCCAGLTFNAATSTCEATVACTPASQSCTSTPQCCQPPDSATALVCDTLNSPATCKECVNEGQSCNDALGISCCTGSGLTCQLGTCRAPVVNTCRTEGASCTEHSDCCEAFRCSSDSNTCEPSQFSACSEESFGNVMLLSALAALAMAALIGLAYMAGSAMENARMLTWAKTEIFEVFASLFVVALVIFALSSFCTFTVGEITEIATGSVPVIYQGHEGATIYEGASMYLESLAGAGLRNMAQQRSNVAAYEIRTTFQKYDCEPIQCFVTLMSVTVAEYSGESLDLAVANNLVSTATVSYLSILFQYFTLQYIANGLFVIFLPLAIVVRSIPFMRGFGGAMVGIIIALYVMYPLAQVSGAIMLPYVSAGFGAVNFADRDGTSCSGADVFSGPDADPTYNGPGATPPFIVPPGVFELSAPEITAKLHSPLSAPSSDRAISAPDENPVLLGGYLASSDSYGFCPSQAWMYSVCTNHVSNDCSYATRSACSVHADCKWDDGGTAWDPSDDSCMSWDYLCEGCIQAVADSTYCSSILDSAQCTEDTRPGCFWTGTSCQPWNGCPGRPNECPVQCCTDGSCNFNCENAGAGLQQVPALTASSPPPTYDLCTASSSRCRYICPLGESVFGNVCTFGAVQPSCIMYEQTGCTSSSQCCQPPYSNPLACVDGKCEHTDELPATYFDSSSCYAAYGEGRCRMWSRWKLVCGESAYNNTLWVCGVCENPNSQWWCPLSTTLPPACSNNGVCDGSETYLTCPAEGCISSWGVSEWKALVRMECQNNPNEGPWANLCSGEGNSCSRTDCGSLTKDKCLEAYVNDKGCYWDPFILSPNKCALDWKCPASNSLPSCGNLACEDGEETYCPSDCCPPSQPNCPTPYSLCGNFKCDRGESSNLCPNDFNGECDFGESSATCLSECPVVQQPCGDGVCRGTDGEDHSSCPADCPEEPSCGDGTCSESDGEDLNSCPADCEPVETCVAGVGDECCSGANACITGLTCLDNVCTLSVVVPGVNDFRVGCQPTAQTEDQIGGRGVSASDLPTATGMHDAIKVNVLMFIAAVFLPALQFIIIAALARDISGMLGDETDIMRLGQMV